MPISQGSTFMRNSPENIKYSFVEFNINPGKSFLAHQPY